MRMTDPRLAMDAIDRMHKAMRVAGLNIGQIADGLDVSRNTVSNWLNGHTTPRRRDMVAYAMLTGVPFDWLLYGSISDERNDTGVISVTVPYRTYTLDTPLFEDSALLDDSWAA